MIGSSGRGSRQSAFVADQRVVEKLGGPQQVLQRFPASAALYEIAQWPEFLLAERTIKLEVEIHPLLPKRMREQDPQIFAKDLEACQNRRTNQRERIR